jgi:hypothetical protein
MNLEDRVNQRIEKGNKIYDKFLLKFNPFPKSGTANTNESSELTKYLCPIDSKVRDVIDDYVFYSLYSNNEADHKLICTITGDYGTGKTQLLLYAKYLIQSLPRKAYVIYINNPENKLSKLIGSIIEQIGQEQFKKYLWDFILTEMKSDKNEYREMLENFVSVSRNKTVFSASEIKKGLFSPDNEVSHKALLDSFLEKLFTKEERKEFNLLLRGIIIKILLRSFGEDEVITNYFYDLISEDVGISKTWDVITSGGANLDNKVVKLLNAIITIIKAQGFDRFYILVDEFEDITSGRLTKKEIDNYSHSLRTLIDKERRWCLLIAMTTAALKELTSISPPLVDRLKDREIHIERLTKEQARQIIINYLNLARKEGNEEKESLFPFTEGAVDLINNEAEGLQRLVLRKAFTLLEKAVEEIPPISVIDENFVKKTFEL